MKAAAAAAGIQTEEQRQIYKNQETFIINLCVKEEKQQQVTFVLMLLLL